MQNFKQKEWKKKFLRLKKQFFFIFWPYFRILGPKNCLNSCKGGVSWQVRMDMVLENLHAKFGTHSSSSLVTIAAQTEICQKVAFFSSFFDSFLRIFHTFHYPSPIKLWNQVTVVQGNRFLWWFQWSWVYLKNLFNFLENCKIVICNFFLLCYNSQIKGPSPMYFFLSAGKWLKGVWCKISNKRSEKKNFNG